ncbi:MAG: FG-GAP repeat protein, partial [Planctomycetes bacterium]|nr:FG-GAP repeat protein [Planctomycetota bacterium]
MSARAKRATVGTIGLVAVISGVLFGTFPGIVANAEPAAAGQLPVLNELQKLTASDAAEGDQFGSAVSVSGDWAIVGAPFDDGEQTDSGSAYVLRRDDNGTPANPNDDTWIQEAKLTAPDAAEGDRFGISVSIDSGRVIVGAPGDDHAGDGSGSAHVFRHVGGSWIHETKLVASDSGGGDWFGGSVCLRSDRIVVGAPFDSDISTYGGSVYVFRDDGLSWVEQQELLASDGALGD